MPNGRICLTLLANTKDLISTRFQKDHSRQPELRAAFCGCHRGRSYYFLPDEDKIQDGGRGAVKCTICSKKRLKTASLAVKSIQV